jgi:hypothetical protein
LGKGFWGFGYLWALVSWQASTQAPQPMHLLMSNKVASCVFSSGRAAAAAPGKLPAATPAAAAIPLLRNVLLEMSCPNLISFQVKNGVRSAAFLIFARKEPADDFRLQKFLLSEHQTHKGKRRLESTFCLT